MTTRTSRPRRPARSSATVVATVSVLCMGLLLASSPAGAVEPAVPTRSSEATRAAGPAEPADAAAESAEEALADVQQIIGGEVEQVDPSPGPAQTTEPAPEPVAEDLSLALRDLALQLPDLDRADRRTARRLLARPTSWFGGDVIAYSPGADLSSQCGPRVCVHYVEDSPDAPPVADVDDDEVPDQVQLTLATTEDVWDRTLALGYRPPLRDRVDVADPDGSGRFDVYLADLGGLDPRGSFYGYCAWERKPGYEHAGSSYCVVDNDFAVEQYGTDPLHSLQETIAHEFFHAVQFAYDAADDLWFMESSAVWIEDVLFDDANGHRMFLGHSQLAFPGRPLDDPRARYGGWVLLRWLSEKFGPEIVLEAWRQADSVKGPDRWGAQAIDAALRARGTSLGRQLSAYATALRFAETSFEEGSEPGWSSAATDQRVLLGRRAPSRGLEDVRVRQLASVAVDVPTRPATRRMRRLVVSVDTPARFRGVKVSLVQVRRDGTRLTRTVPLDRTGAGRARIGFSRSAVERVLVVLTGTSIRMRCWQGSSLSCEGLRRDDRLPVDLRLTGR